MTLEGMLVDAHPRSFTSWGEIKEAFSSGDAHPLSQAPRLLLDNPSTAINHYDPRRVDASGRPKPLLLAANYHRGHSEGDYKSIVQDVEALRGPWVLFRPPQSNERTFYLQDLTLPHSLKPEFREDVENARKIDNRVTYVGDPRLIFFGLLEDGYYFSDETMPERRWEQLYSLSEGFAR